MRFQYSRAWLSAAGEPEWIAAGASDSTRRPDAAGEGRTDAETPVAFSPALRCQPAAVPVAVAVLSRAHSTHFQAQTPPVRGDTLVAGQRIHCIKQLASTDDIATSTPGITVKTTEDQEHGITGQHSSAETTGFESSPNTVSAGGRLSQGTPSSNKGNSMGDVFRRLFPTEIRTNGSGAASSAVGNFGETAASGRLDSVVTGGSIATRSEGSHGIFQQHKCPGSGPAYSLTLNVGGGIAIETSGGGGVHGIFGRRLNGAGDVLLDLRRLSVSTGGDSTGGIPAGHGSEGNTDIRVAGGGVAIRGWTLTASLTSTSPWSSPSSTATPPARRSTRLCPAPCCASTRTAANTGRRRRAVLPLWLRVSGVTGRYGPRSATVGARSRWTGVWLVWGTVRVSPPVGGGRIAVVGLGLGGGQA